jgi:hypothetical protein
MAENKNEENMHTLMMHGMIKQLEELDVEVIEADLEGYRQPKGIEKKKPDIIGKNKNGTKIIIAVETDQNIDKEKYEEFSQAEGEFWVEVPESRSKEFGEKIKEWGIPINKWFVGKDV